MPKLTDEQQAQRAADRRRREAVEAEAAHERHEAKRREWRMTGACLTREELEAGEPCRACGLPVMDRLSDWPRPKDRTPEQQAAYDTAEVEYRARHADRYSHRWSMSESRSMHCGDCCPPHRLHQSQLDLIAAIVRTPPKPKELDTWRLTLTCEHTVDRSMHRSNVRWSTRVVECATCGTHRGAVTAERIEVTTV